MADRHLTAAPQEALSSLREELGAFDAFGRPSEIGELRCPELPAVPVFRNQFWTSLQRRGSSLHEVSYLACFKPELPRFFLERLTEPGQVVLDPFMGRGTTLIEAALLGRVPWGKDANPLSRVMAEARLLPPTEERVAARLAEISSAGGALEEELLVFFHPLTLARIQGLRRYFLERGEENMDAVDRWIRVVALNRLTGHSAGFFSVYTMPPNQAASIHGQRRINRRRQQVPPERDVDALILRKTRTLLKTVTAEQRRRLAAAAPAARFLTGDSRSLRELPDGQVSLAVTSPPFLNVYDYARINWLRCWFCGIDPDGVGISTPSGLPAWRDLITTVLRECFRVARPGGWMAFEVGEVRKGSVRLEEHVLPCGVEAGWEPALVLINAQEFTKTSVCWGVDNNSRGTNTNRVVLMRKPGNPARFSGPSPS